MGIDYVIDVDCTAKQKLGVERIVEMVKARTRAEMVIAMERQNGSEKSPSEITFVVAVNRMGKLEEQRVSVQQLLDQATPLDQHVGGCAKCPANRGSERGYGCYDSISYPLEADTEKWLLSCLPAKADGGVAYLIKSALDDFGWDGAQAAEMRSQGETFFRLSKAPVRTWPEQTVQGDELAVSADQLFQMMFHVGHLGHEHCKILCMFLGLLVVEGEDNEPSAEVQIESANAEQMVRFVNSLAFAAQNEVDILIDG